MFNGEDQGDSSLHDVAEVGCPADDDSLLTPEPQRKPQIAWAEELSNDASVITAVTSLDKVAENGAVSYSPPLDQPMNRESRPSSFKSYIRGSDLWGRSEDGARRTASFKSYRSPRKGVSRGDDGGKSPDLRSSPDSSSSQGTGGESGEGSGQKSDSTDYTSGPHTSASPPSR